MPPKALSLTDFGYISYETEPSLETLKSSKFGKLKNSHISPGVKYHAIKFDLSNRSDSTVTKMLRLPPVIANLTFYVISTDGSVATFKSGINVPFSERPILDHGYAIEIDLEAEESKKIFVVANSPFPFNFSLKIYSPKEFSIRLFVENALYLIT